jgi:hypothetical protein
VRLLVKSDSREIAVLDPNEDEPFPDGFEIIEVSDNERDKFNQAGSYKLSLGLVVEFTPIEIDPIPVEPESGYTRVQITTRLADIINNGGNYTNTQVRQAVIDLARMMRKTMWYIRNNV